ncbi:MAG: membrane protein insertion efficiency factor YidD [Candidatus Nanopelagicales bacterium]
MTTSQPSLTSRAGSRTMQALHIIGLPFGWLLIGIIRIYQLVLSPLLGPKCRFYPSCSNYAIGAVRTHGPIKGSTLATYRICRCHPWQLGGIDPVPAKGAWRPDTNLDGTPRNSGDGSHLSTSESQCSY